MKTRTKKELEYPDAPSGSVTLYNYKEPFMAFDGGYGFQGVLLFDSKTDDAQCHFCGEFFHYLPHHIQKEHNMTAWQYKDAVGLRQRSVLIGETTREKLVASGLENRLKNLKPGKKKTKAQRAKIRETLKNFTRESQNERGTCPMQLIHRLKAIEAKIGRTPTHKEIPFAETLRRVFGSVERAFQIARIKHRKSGQNVQHRAHRILNEDLLAILRNFKETHGREASFSDYKRGLIRNPGLYSRRFGSWAKAKELAYEK